MIRQVTEAGDALWARLAGIHAASFEHGWGADELRKMAATAHNRLYIVEDDVAVCFILLTVVAGEGEILTIATAPDHRGQGHAGRLLAYVAETLAVENVEAIFLEVAIDNAAAIAVYKRAGFASAGLRKGYYSRAGGAVVDACILRLALG
ncbi:GNAT family N-acetyltransferase [Asticcacaulis solisilvae]|uniref:GNAT family N-acetyltransferase n=1 Tax=Asticcacaulis solisilvae TaxID=1217274 RepID=UPI003FD74D78